jgi:pimeloyl-ACP methyl ester carboxylesterase
MRANVDFQAAGDEPSNAPGGGAVSVNSLEMYYESRGVGSPLVLLHGAMSTIETSFGAVIPHLAQTRRLIAVEQQGHGRTPDANRPLSYAQMARDTAMLIRKLNIEKADFFGYSMGAGIALELAMQYPELVRRLIVASLAYSNDGFHPATAAQLMEIAPDDDDLAGSIFREWYVRVAPSPENWWTLVRKCNELDRQFQGWRPGDIQAITAPTLIIIGDSDIVRPEHAVEIFRLLGGGVDGDSAGLPASQLAVLPATTHLTIVERADWLVSMISGFLDAR